MAVTDPMKSLEKLSDLAEKITKFPVNLLAKRTPQK